MGLTSGHGPLPVRSRRWLRDPVESGRAAGFGVYLHVPFCRHRCGYCDFATEAVGSLGGGTGSDRFRRYVDALVADLGRQVAGGPAAHAPVGGGDHLDVDWPAVTSIFVGGGTPTLLGGELLARVVACVGAELDLADGAEVTVECNPETVDDELFGPLVDAGVTRVSIGAQSFVEHVLATLERGHGPEGPVVAVEAARAAGIREVGLDLIYGTPGESPDEWLRTVTRAAGVRPDHLSAYALTIHDNTPFGRSIATGGLASVDEDAQRERFDVARDVLGGAGYDHYEVSNWSLGPGRRSRHNVLYWRHGDYLGVGVGAHGHMAGRRWWSTRATDRYLEAVEREASPIVGDEVLSDAERATERLLLGLRLREGLHPADVPPLDPVALQDALDAGLVGSTDGRLRCTADGWFLLDEAVRRLLP